MRPKVFASTFLGSQEFIERIWKRAKGETVQDTRNLPVIRILADKPSLGVIKQTVETEFESPPGRLCREMPLYISRQKEGFSLKEMGALGGMKEAAVSQAVGRFRRAIQETASLKEEVQKVLRKLNMSNVEL